MIIQNQFCATGLNQMRSPNNAEKNDNLNKDSVVISSETSIKSENHTGCKEKLINLLKRSETAKRVATAAMLIGGAGAGIGIGLACATLLAAGAGAAGAALGCSIGATAALGIPAATLAFMDRHNIQ